MERIKLSSQMTEQLKRFILRERRKKKEEDVANEQKMKEEMVRIPMTLLKSLFETRETQYLRIESFFQEKS